MTLNDTFKGRKVSSESREEEESKRERKIDESLKVDEGKMKTVEACLRVR